MTNEKKAEEFRCRAYEGVKGGVIGDDFATIYADNIKAYCLDMAKWKDEQINLLLDAIDYAYLKTDGTYGDLPLVVVDEVKYLKSLRHGKIE